MSGPPTRPIAGSTRSRCMGRVVSTFAVSTTLLVIAAGASVTGCRDNPKYTPTPAYSGAKASMPKVPQVPGPNTWKNGSNWTVYGVQHSLNHPRHRKEVDATVLTIDGYVVDV